MSIKKSFLITALSVFLLGGAAQAFAKTVLLHAPAYNLRSYVVLVNGKQQGYCSQYVAGNGWQKTKANANRNDSVEVIIYKGGCYTGSIMKRAHRTVGDDKLKYFWFKM